MLPKPKNVSARWLGALWVTRESEQERRTGGQEGRLRGCKAESRLQCGNQADGGGRPLASVRLALFMNSRPKINFYILQPRATWHGCNSSLFHQTSMMVCLRPAIADTGLDCQCSTRSLTPPYASVRPQPSQDAINLSSTHASSSPSQPSQSRLMAHLPSTLIN